MLQGKFKLGSSPGKLFTPHNKALGTIRAYQWNIETKHGHVQNKLLIRYANMSKVLFVSCFTSGTTPTCKTWSWTNIKANSPRLLLLGSNRRSKYQTLSPLLLFFFQNTKEKSRHHCFTAHYGWLNCSFSFSSTWWWKQAWYLDLLHLSHTHTWTILVSHIFFLSGYLIMCGNKASLVILSSWYVLCPTSFFGYFVCSLGEHW